MTKKQIERLERQRACLAKSLGEELAAIAEGDTAVMTARLPERDRPAAQRYREVVQQLAGC